MSWCACFTMPRCKGMAKIMPAEILYTRPHKCIAPRLGIHLNDGIALIGENMRRMIAPPLFQYPNRSVVKWDGMGAPVLVLSSSDPQMPSLQTDLLPAKLLHVSLSQLLAPMEY